MPRHVWDASVWSHLEFDLKPCLLGTWKAYEVLEHVAKLSVVGLTTNARVEDEFFGTRNLLSADLDQCKQRL